MTEARVSSMNDAHDLTFPTIYFLKGICNGQHLPAETNQQAHLTENPTDLWASTTSLQTQSCSFPALVSSNEGAAANN